MLRHPKVTRVIGIAAHGFNSFGLSGRLTSVRLGAQELVRTLLFIGVGCGWVAGALAAPYTVQVSEVEMNNNGAYVDASGNVTPAIFVRGTFTPALPCAQQGFFLIAADPFLQETLALILSAKATGAPLGFTHVYCHTNGYSRGNTISVQ